MAGDSQECRRLLVKQGVIKPLVTLLNVSLNFYISFKKLE